MNVLVSGPMVTPSQAHGIEDYNVFSGNTSPDLPDLNDWANRIDSARDDVLSGEIDSSERELKSVGDDISRYSWNDLINTIDKYEVTVTNLSKALQDIRNNVGYHDLETASTNTMQSLLEEVMSIVEHHEPDSKSGSELRAYVKPFIRTFIDRFDRLKNARFNYDPMQQEYKAIINIDGICLRIRVVSACMVITSNGATMLLGQNLQRKDGVMFSSPGDESVSYTMDDFKSIFEDPWRPTVEEGYMMKMVYPNHHCDILNLLLSSVKD